MGPKFQGSKFTKKGYLVKTGWIMLQKQTIPNHSSQVHPGLAGMVSIITAQSLRDSAHKMTVPSPALNPASPGTSGKENLRQACTSALETPSWK